MINRRTDQGYKLRVYIDAIKEVKSMSDSQWLEQWVANAKIGDTYMSRAMWLSYLEGCALEEAESFAAEAA